MKQKIQTIFMFGNATFVKHQLKKKALILFLFVFNVLVPFQLLKGQNNLKSFTFSLTKSSTTSAGIFRKDSTLVRTLWNNVKYPAGTHTAHWDRKDDEGFLVNDSIFDVRVVSSNMTYTWEGTIGNSSDSIVGISKHRYYTRPNSMAIFGNTAYYTVGYTEGITSAYKLNLSSPQNKIGILYNTNHNVDQEGSFTATDGTNVYWAGYDPFNVNVSFVYGTSVSNDQEVNFSSGSSIGMTFGRTYNAAIDLYTNNAAARPSGLAVQKLGNYLFVAHAQLNELHVLNKSTGALVQTISVTNPRQLCVDMNDNLWMIAGTNSVQKFTVNNNGTLSSPTLSIPNLLEPLNLAVSPNNYLIVVTDGGSSQQIKAFNNANANSVWTFGQAGGYSSDATVANDKFFFSHTPTEIKGSFIAFQADSSFWVGDPGNERVLHFSSNRTFIERIMSLPHSYSVQADVNNPTRVFNEYLEFKIDYSKSLSPNNGSWTLVKNWRYGVPAKYYQDFKAHILRNVITLSNGRTYATIEDLSAQYVRTPEFVELQDSGNLRFTGIKLQPFENFIIDPDGTIRTLIADSRIGSNGVWKIRSLNGFDNQNNPIWGNQTNYTTSPKVTLNDPFCDGPSYPAKTNSDLLVVFNPWEQDANGKGKGYHLGALKKGSNKWLWQTSKATDESYVGPMPSDGAFDLGNNVQYPGGHVYAIENNIFWNYHGEFWKNSQTNIWNHFHENGLMVSQFGIVSPDGSAFYEQAFPMGAGNVFSSVFTKVGNDYYLYHNDESVHAGVHRWKISGLNSIQVQSSSLNLATVNGGLTAAYFDSKNLDNFKFIEAQVTPTVNLSSPPSQVADTNNFAVKWTGFVKSKYKEDYTFYTNSSNGVKLWINGNLIIDQWNNTSNAQFNSVAIALDPTKKYTIKMEINGGTASLSWSSTSQAKQIIPSSNLYPGNAPDYSNAYDLLEGLTPKTILQNNIYGWSRNSTNEDNTNFNKYWNVKTGLKSHNKDNTDIYICFKQSNNDYYVTRDLGRDNTCLSSWSLNGRMTFDGNFASWEDWPGGLQIDVLDDQGKVIARITHEMLYKPDNSFPSFLKINGTKVIAQNRKTLNTILDKQQKFTIDVDQNGVHFKYANLTPVDVTLFDSTANWNKPKTLNVNFVSNSSNNYDRAIGFSELSFSSVGMEANVTANGPTVICQGQTVKLNASTGNTYLWNNNSTTQNITVSNSGDYSVKMKDANGCEATSNVISVTVNPLPNATITASGPTIICQGDNLTLTANTAKSYLWNNSKTTKDITVNSTENFTVTITDTNGCKNTSATMPIVANPVPTPSVTLLGNSVTSNYSSGNQWFLDGVMLSGMVNQTCPIIKAGNYSVEVTNAFGCKGTDVLLVPLPANENDAELSCLGNNELKLEWKITGSDENILYTIDYSIDGGVQWIPLTSVQNDGDQFASVKDYSAQFKKIAHSDCFYKWSKISYEGEVKSSKIMADPNCSQELNVISYPNPFSKTFSIQLPTLTLNEGSYELIVRNSLNQIVLQKTLDANETGNSNNIYEIKESGNFLKAIYFVQVLKNDNSIFSGKMIKMN